MLKRAGVDHMLRAAAGISRLDRFVMIGSGAAIAVQPRLPLAMMLTSEIDIYPDGVPDPSDVSELIATAIGRDSQFHRTFHYYVDGVGPGTATLPEGWRERLIPYTSPDAPGVTALCLDLTDLAVAKMCAGREKDIAWLRAAIEAGLLSRAGIERRLDLLTDPRAPDRAVLSSRLDAAA
ncbi:MAG TPA: DUF6036 family nucleotidyltransferase [Falsiroseomonas sp.]|jgi:hypothetical protein|nr:DUF6036 family nucleotidyltransferase [Falsiroseomonas sp.]